MFSRASRRLYSSVPRTVEVSPEYLENVQRFTTNTLVRSKYPKGTPQHAIELWNKWPDNVPAPGQEITKEYIDKKYPCPPTPKFKIWGGLIGFPVTDPVKFRYMMLTKYEERSRELYTHFMKNSQKPDFNVLGGSAYHNFENKVGWAACLLSLFLFIPVLLTITVFNRTFLYQNIIKGSIFDMTPAEPYRKVRRDETGRFYIGK